MLCKKSQLTKNRPPGSLIDERVHDELNGVQYPHKACMFLKTGNPYGKQLNDVHIHWPFLAGHQKSSWKAALLRRAFGHIHFYLDR